MSQSKWRLRFSTSYWLCKCRYSIYSTYYGNRDTRSGFITLNDFTSLKGWVMFSFGFGAENPPAEAHCQRFRRTRQRWRGQRISNELSYWAARNQHEPNSTAHAASATKPAVSPGPLWVLNTPDTAPRRAWKCLPFVLPFPIHSELTVLFCSVNMLLSLARLWTLSLSVSRTVLMNDSALYAHGPRGVHVCGGPSSGQGTSLSRWGQKDTCSPLSATQSCCCACMKSSFRTLHGNSCCELCRKFISLKYMLHKLKQTTCVTHTFRVL